VGKTVSMATADPAHPSVTVIVPAYNAATTIARALASVAAQGRGDMEVIVVDDSSVDGTADIVRAFSDLKVRLLRTEARSGAAAARNLGIRHARGRYVAFLDADDAWLPGKLDRQLATFESDPDLVFVSCDSELVDETGRMCGKVDPNRRRAVGHEGWKTLLKHSCVATPSVVVRRQALLDVGGFDPDLPVGEDQDLWIRLAGRGPIGHLDETLVRVHDQPDGLTGLARGGGAVPILSVVHRNLRRYADRLERADRRAVLAERYTNIGRNQYVNGHPFHGLRLLCGAIAQGAAPWQTFRYLMTASPPARFAKRLLRGESTAAWPLVSMSDGMPPLLMVIVDTEEEFDWTQPFSKYNTSVESIALQPLAQEIHDRYGIVPTYVLDYPVANDDDAAAVIAGFLADGRCEIGSHLQPWVNPPYVEVESAHHSYPGNLPFALEYGKLHALTDRIQQRFGRRPRIYKAGRYGLGPSTMRILRSLGYDTDVSVVPHTSFRWKGGPDFRGLPDRPFWFGGERDLLEVPLTRGFCGLLWRWGYAIFPVIGSRLGETLRLPGLFAALKLLDRITLTPEGVTLDEQIRLVRAMVGRGHKVFCYTYHSSTLLPGATGYVKTEEDQRRFLERMDGFFAFFLNQLGGKAVSVAAFREQVAPADIPFDRSRSKSTE